MENRKEFLIDLYKLLDKYNVEINLHLDGDTHGLESWLTIDYIIDAKRWKTEEVLRINDSVDKYEIEHELHKMGILIWNEEQDGQ